MLRQEGSRNPLRPRRTDLARLSTFAVKANVESRGKVGFAKWRADYTETVYDDLISLETDGESRYATLGKYYVKSTIFDDRVLSSIAT